MKLSFYGNADNDNSDDDDDDCDDHNEVRGTQTKKTKC